MFLKVLLINLLITSLASSTVVWGAAATQWNFDCDRELQTLSTYGQSYVPSKQIREAHKGVLDQLARQELTEAPLQQKYQQREDLEIEFAKALSLDESQKITELYFKNLEPLRETLTEAHRCGDNATCLVTKIKIAKLKLSRIIDTVWSSWSADRRARNLIDDTDALKAAVELVAHQVIGNGDLDPNKFAQDIGDRIEATKNHRPTSDITFSQRYRSTIQKAWARENIRTRPEVKRNLYTTLALTLSAQTVTSVAKAILTSHGAGAAAVIHAIAQDSWVPPNAAAMINIQTEISGGLNPKIIYPFTDFESGMQGIPLFIHSKKGFSREFVTKFRELYFISAIEIPIVLALRSVILGLQRETNVVIWISSIMSAGLFLATNYGYSGLKDTVFNGPVILNFFENYRDGARLRFERALYTATGQTEEFVSFSDGLKKDYKAYKSYFTEPTDPRFTPELANLYHDYKSVSAREISFRVVNMVIDAVVCYSLVWASGSVVKLAIEAAQQFLPH